jgi:UDPglucose 6-dehydrogenase
MTYDSKYEEMAVYGKEGSYTQKVDDPFLELIDHCKLIFLCLPTPMSHDGSCDISIICSVLNNLDLLSENKPKKTNVVIKSTIPPGTTEQVQIAFPNLNICFNPEFLREATAEDDFKNQQWIIAAGNEDCAKILEDVYKETLPQAVFLFCKEKIAEMVKYTINCYLATKVSFANEIKQICDKLKISYNDMIQLATRDERLGKSHWQVPGPMPADDGSRMLLHGFGGSCFVKDLNALIDVAYELGIDPLVMKAAWDKNVEVRPERDWENLVGRAVVDRRTKSEDQKERVA